MDKNLDVLEKDDSLSIMSDDNAIANLLKAKAVNYLPDHSFSEALSKSYSSIERSISSLRALKARANQ